MLGANETGILGRLRPNTAQGSRTPSGPKDAGLGFGCRAGGEGTAGADA